MRFFASTCATVPLDYCIEVRDCSPFVRFCVEGAGFIRLGTENALVRYGTVWLSLSTAVSNRCRKNSVSAAQRIRLGQKCGEVNNGGYKASNICSLISSIGRGSQPANQSCFHVLSSRCFCLNSPSNPSLQVYFAQTEDLCQSLNCGCLRLQTAAKERWTWNSSKPDVSELRGTEIYSGFAFLVQQSKQNDAEKAGR